jgi:hypothetical protein
MTSINLSPGEPSEIPPGYSFRMSDFSYHLLWHDFRILLPLCLLLSVGIGLIVSGFLMMFVMVFGLDLEQSLLISLLIFLVVSIGGLITTPIYMLVDHKNFLHELGGHSQFYIASYNGKFAGYIHFVNYLECSLIKAVVIKYSHQNSIAEEALFQFAISQNPKPIYVMTSAELMTSHQIRGFTEIRTADLPAEIAVLYQQSLIHTMVLTDELADAQQNEIIESYNNSEWLPPEYIIRLIQRRPHIGCISVVWVIECRNRTAGLIYFKEYDEYSTLDIDNIHTFHTNKARTDDPIDTYLLTHSLENIRKPVYTCCKSSQADTYYRYGFVKIPWASLPIQMRFSIHNIGFTALAVFRNRDSSNE